MTTTLVAQPLVTRPLDAETFAPFGDVISVKEPADMLINQGMCERFHDLACLDFDRGRAGISLFRAKIAADPLRQAVMERHPLGSQAFLPLYPTRFLVVVGEGQGDTPVALHAFVTAPYQGVNYHRNVWHAPLVPLEGEGMFAVIDRIAPVDDERSNLEVCRYDVPFEIASPRGVG